MLRPDAVKTSQKIQIQINADTNIHNYTKAHARTHTPGRGQRGRVYLLYEAMRALKLADAMSSEGRES